MATDGKPVLLSVDFFCLQKFAAKLRYLHQTLQRGCCKTVKESMRSSVSYFLSVKQDMAEKNNNFFPFFLHCFYCSSNQLLEENK